MDPGRDSDGHLPRGLDRGGDLVTEVDNGAKDREPALADSKRSTRHSRCPPTRRTRCTPGWTKIGFVNYWNNVLEPLSNALYNNPFFAAMFSGFDPYLPLLGNPLIFLSPYNVAFALGYPMDIGSYVAYLSQTFFYIGLDLTAAFASEVTPTTIGFTILFTTVEAVGTIITDTIALLKTLLEQTVVLLTVFAPLVTAPLVTLAAGAVAPVGLAGLAGLAALPAAPPVAPPITPPVLALPPSVPTATSSPTPAAMEGDRGGRHARDATTVGYTTNADRRGHEHEQGASMAAGMNNFANFAYLVGDLSAVAGAAAAGRARKKAPEPESVATPAAAATPTGEGRNKAATADEGADARARLRIPGLGDDEGADAVTASATGAGIRGFAGTVTKTGAGRAAGLTTLADDAFGGRPACR